MAHEVATESVEAVRFGFMTDEEVKKLSVQKITDAILMDAVGRPLPGGLYDPAMGPLDEGANCKSCGQRAYICPGHFGHIDLVSVVYNPLLFNTLVKLLRRTCFHCCHFTADREEVQYYVSKLKLVARGDIIGARMIEPKSLHSFIQDISEDGLSSTDEVHVKKGDDQVWTSLQQDEARSALNEFLGKKSRKCLNCSTKTATLSKPTFGWIQRSGVIEAFLTVDDDKPSSEVENSDIEEVISSIAPADEEQRSTKPQKRVKKDSKIEIPGQKNAATSLLPSQARNILRRLWENEAELCSFICDISQEHKCAARKTSGYSMFFLKTLPVPPSKFRPPARTGDSVMEHPQTMLLGKILESNLYLGNALEQRAVDSVFIRRLMLLQQSINVYFDSKTSVGKAEKEASGICQLLEKKEGIFRQKMMGKRVNFACRSVISPDPYLAVNEIGIPPAFALKLTYPERITPWNVMKLRDAVINGPDNHPGATHYADRMGSIKLLAPNTRLALSRKLASSRGAVSQLGKNSNCEFEGKVIQRHIRNGDAVLANRQPTLHKPSICGFRARILPGEKTLRMHYVNCDSFNADFDGDEINVHLPQDEISRAETYNIVNADYQYIVPTRGDPKRALIQDHIVSAVLLTKRDTFLTYTEFNQLLYSSGMSGSSAWSVDVKPGKKVSVIESEDLIESLPPAIVKPHRLWTGKQIISAILKHITKGERFTVKKRAKIAREYFGADESKKKHLEELSKKNSKHSARKNKVSSLKIIEGDPTENTDEDTVFVFKNELVQGVIDKEQFGKYGLVHTVQELFGSSAAGNLLSILSRVLTAFLQLHGFTCGVDDILLVQDYEHKRKQLLDACLHCGEEVHQQFIGSNNSAKDLNEMQVEIEKAILRNGEPAVALLDAMMRNKLNSSSSALSKLFPDGLTKPFRKNCLSLMTLSGAKGGTFNFQQISILLGQQELEGKRVPRMVSGKTLPCFPSWDTASRAGGFISDRYLTGLRPQEFYFHCMAGREGLVDTAVKTSRSGYLQRCLVKNLESLKVHYDYTVRDADGSIVQFFYGEDGVDVHQKNFLQEFDALALNKKIVEKNLLTKDVDVCVSVYAEEDNEYPSELARKTNDFLNDEKRAKSYGILRKKDRSKFVQMVKNKYFLSLAQPGEPVGVIAAQSIGEPSTQMTLNTFHHAGRGEMNVTLGIPRLQEILMTASALIRTPTMTCPLHRFKTSDDAERLAAGMRKITVADLIEKMEVCVLPFTVSKHEVSSVYKLRIKLYDPKLYPPHTDITLEDCQDVLREDFLTVMEDSIHRHLLLLSRISGIKNFIADARMNASDETKDDDGDGNKLKKDAESTDDDDDANEEGADDLGLDVQKSRQQTTDEMDYEETSRSEHQLAESDEEDESEDGEPKQVKSKPQRGGDDEEEDHDLDDGDDSSDDDGDDSNLERKKLAFEVDSEIDQAEHADKEGTIPEKESPLRSNSQKQTRNEKQMKKKKPVARQSKKRVDRAIHLECSGTHFEVHFKLVNEPHMLLSELAQKAAKKVCVKSSGKIEQCKVVELHMDDSGSKKAGGIPMLRKGKESRVALQTAGIDFATFWELQDDLDVNYISSNDIHAVLNTYGVEAARAAIITEVFRVFNHYGVSVDMRHLTLVADFMTHTGGYRPLNRIGGIADSTSPFARMTFETASKFIVEASSSGEKDSLETPSARVCLGLPVKVGTGCFDLLHNLEV